MLSRTEQEDVILRDGGRMLEQLVAKDDWLPSPLATPHPERYTQYLLHLDDRRRFSVVSFVWGPGQKTPVHDHTVWGLVGVLRGAEISRSYAWTALGLSAAGGTQRMEPGTVTAVSPRIGDIHEVSNAFQDRTSISIHVYGGDIGRISRHVYAADGGRKPFVSGYTLGSDAPASLS
jgi:predicted metal-dependent enzyme (double-stranded beta helix superfamily)